MRVIFLPDWITIISFVVIWPLIQVPISMIGNYIPDKKFNTDSFWFREWRWEKKWKVYENFFKIRKWKKILPDGARVFNSGFEKGELKNLTPEYLEAFIAETCRAETVHWIQMTPFWIFGLWAPSFVIWIMLIYALILNMPCIIAQRYNRPRLKNIYAGKMEKSQELNENGGNNEV